MGVGITFSSARGARIRMSLVAKVTAGTSTYFSPNQRSHFNRSAINQGQGTPLVARLGKPGCRSNGEDQTKIIIAATAALSARKQIDCSACPGAVSSGATCLRNESSRKCGRREVHDKRVPAEAVGGIGERPQRLDILNATNRIIDPLQFDGCCAGKVAYSEHL